MAPRHNETFIPQVVALAQETATNHSRSPVEPNQDVVSQGHQEQISLFPFTQNQLHQRWRLPSIAYFMSRANRFHMISALILPTFSSCENLVEWKEIPVRITSSLSPRTSPGGLELQQTTDVQEDVLAKSHYPIIPHPPSIIPITGWIRAERWRGGVENEKNEWIQEEMAQLRGESAWRRQNICPKICYAYRFPVLCLNAMPIV